MTQSLAQLSFQRLLPSSHTVNLMRNDSLSCSSSTQGLCTGWNLCPLPLDLILYISFPFNLPLPLHFTLLPFPSSCSSSLQPLPSIQSRSLSFSLPQIFFIYLFFCLSGHLYFLLSTLLTLSWLPLNLVKKTEFFFSLTTIFSTIFSLPLRLNSYVQWSSSEREKHHYLFSFAVDAVQPLPGDF